MKKITLLELLVVIAVIGILLTLLIPSLRNARLLSKTAVSMSNLKQLYVGSNIYASNHNGYLFKCSGNPHYWTRKVFEAINGEESYSMAPGSLFRDLNECPVIAEFKRLKGSPNGFSSYSLNIHFGSYRNLGNLNGNGEVEVFMGSSQGTKKAKASPSLRKTLISQYNVWQGLTWVYPKNSSLGSYIDGSVKLISASDGAKMSGPVKNGNNFD